MLSWTTTDVLWCLATQVAEIMFNEMKTKGKDNENENDKQNEKNQKTKNYTKERGTRILSESAVAVEMINNQIKIKKTTK